MSMSRNCRNRLQRLRGWGDDTRQPSGSRGYAPGLLRVLLSSCCSNPRRYGLCPVVRLCECMPWAGAGVKSIGQNARSEIPAKIAALQGQALSRIQYHFTSTACWLEARTGASSPSFFPRAMPP